MIPESIKQLLEGDQELKILTGGIYLGTVISRQSTAEAFDKYQELKPCALIKAPQSTPVGPFKNSQELQIYIYLYQKNGYEIIETARQRIYELLHRQSVGKGCWQISHENDLLHQTDSALGVSMILSRFNVIMER